jgi:hypothetical protein
MKLPLGRNLAGLWMLGDNIGSAGWPNCGELTSWKTLGVNLQQFMVPFMDQATLVGPE